MEEALIDFVAWLEDLQPHWIYLSIFAIAYLENVVPPIPGDMVIVFGGYLVGVGTVAFLPMFALATAGGVAGFMTMYWIGLKVGTAVFDTSRMRWIPKEAAFRARKWILKYGVGVVAANRFLAGARSVISLAVGAAKMAPAPTALWATISSAGWCALILGMGFVLGDQWSTIGVYLQLYGQWMMALIVLAVSLIAGRRAWRWWRDRAHLEGQHRRTSEDPSDSP